MGVIAAGFGSGYGYGYGYGSGYGDPDAKDLEAA